MNEIKWEKSIEGGVEDIDLQHHYFLNLVNRLIREIKKRDNPQYVIALTQELNKYAAFHFNSEETMMKYTNYPEYEQHKMHHLELIQKLSIEEFNLYNHMEDEQAEHIIEFLQE